MDKTERRLKSIDSSLKVIASELKKMNGSAVAIKNAELYGVNLEELASDLERKRRIRERTRG